MRLKIKEWLTSRSSSTRQVRNELFFNHATGHTSVLVVRNAWQDNVINPKTETLQVFYNDFLGASIGDGQILIGSTVAGGLHLSQDFDIPDIDEITHKSKALGMALDESDEVFMVEAAWMFLYCIKCSAAGETLVRYDRDFSQFETVPSIDCVLDDWWQMVTAERRD